MRSHTEYWQNSPINWRLAQHDALCRAAHDHATRTFGFRQHLAEIARTRIRYVFRSDKTFWIIISASFG